MYHRITRLLKLLLGLLLYAIGIALSLKANIGYSPWDVFHAGLASVTGLSIGLASILTGLVIVIVVLILKEKLGAGTILNMVIVGVCLDIILWLNIIPLATNIILGTVMLILGLFIIALGTYFYMSSALGAGPRDSMMVAITRKTKLPVGVCRAIIELIAMVIGWLLGGMVGIGTIISVLSIGFCIQLTFKLLKFDPTTIQHETLEQTWKHFSKAKT